MEPSTHLLHGRKGYLIEYKDNDNRWVQEPDLFPGSDWREALNDWYTRKFAIGHHHVIEATPSEDGRSGMMKMDTYGKDYAHAKATFYTEGIPIRPYS